MANANALDNIVGPVVATLPDGTEYRQVIGNATEGSLHQTPDGAIWIAVREGVVNGVAVASPFTIHWKRKNVTMLVPAMVAARPIITFKHHTTTPTGPGPCEQPLGICIRIPIGRASGALTEADLAAGRGSPEFRVEDGKLLIAFDREAALPDGTIAIEFEKALESDLAADLGFDRIVMKPGVYPVDKSRLQFGETAVEIITGNPVALQQQESVPCHLYSQTTGPCKGCGVACEDGTNYPMNCGADIFKGINNCSGQKITFDPTRFGPPQIYKGALNILQTPVFTERVIGHVEPFDRVGRSVKCRPAEAEFTLIVPLLINV